MRDGIVVVGSLNADLVVRVPHFPAPGETVTGSDFAVHPGGKGANQACAAGRLGGRVQMLGRVGDDAHGALLKASLRQAGVDVTGVVTDPSVATGTALITLDASGQNQIVVVPGANGRVSVADVERQRGVFAAAAFVLLQLETPLDAVAAAARLAREAGARVILDPAPAHPDARSLLELADFVTPNETELECLARRGAERVADEDRERGLARHLLEAGARSVIAKLGAGGARLLTAETDRRWPGIAVEVVDTTAAGDVWNGAFAVALATGTDVDEAGGFANAAAALSVTRAGAQPGMPTRDEVEQLMNRRDGK